MTNTLSHHALTRLQRHRGRLEAAQAAVAQLEASARAYYEQYTDLLRALCEEADIDLPLDGIPARVDIDWKTGAVTWQLTEQVPNGMSMDGVA